MSKTLRIAVLVPAVLSIGFGTRLFGQDAEQTQATAGEPPAFRESPEQTAAYTTALETVRLLVAAGRASRAGFRPTIREDLSWIRDDGNYIRADDFRINPETNQVEAVGNVRMVILRFGTTTTVTADQLTIGEEQ